MSQENNFIPEQQPYRPLRSFQIFMKNNFPFIENTFEGLDYYSLLCEIVKYLNEVIHNENIVKENVQSLYNAFVELNNYVSNYFDNLDVQEEINNKLDEMTEDGTLQEIITTYLDTKAIFCYDNIEEMKEATNLINGSYAKTLGYYNPNDNGGATYKILTTQDGYCESLNNGLYAKLIETKVTPEMFGAKGDGETDDTEAIQTAIDNFNYIIFKNQYVLEDILIEEKENKTLQGISGNQLIFKSETDNKKWFTFYNCNNIVIDNLYFNGNRENQTIKTLSDGVAGRNVTENCPAILLENTSDVIIKNNNFYNLQADGIQADVLYYNQDNLIDRQCKNLKIYNNTFDLCGRNGISIVHAEDIEIKNNQFENLQLFSSTIACAIDIEPNGTNFICKNVLISNNNLYNCLFGINLSYVENSTFENINVTDNIIKATETNMTYGLYISTRDASVNLVNNIIERAIFGIWLTGTISNILIEKNLVKHSVTKAGQTANGGYAIYSGNTSGKIINNTLIEAQATQCCLFSYFTGLFAGNTLEGGTTYGLSIFNFNGEMYNNTIKTTGTRSFVCGTSIDSNSIVMNNSFNKPVEFANAIKNISNNYTQVLSESVSFTSSSTLAVAHTLVVPAMSDYMLTFQPQWVNSTPLEIVVSGSNTNSAISQYAHQEGNYPIPSICGKNTSNTPLSLYIWLKYNGSTSNTMIVKGKMSQ